MSEKLILKVTANHQLTIPAGVREDLDIRPGDFLSLEIDKGTLTLRQLEVREKVASPTESQPAKK